MLYLIHQMKGKNNMDYEKALEILIELMIENKDVLLRLKEGEVKDDEQL